MPTEDLLNIVQAVLDERKGQFIATLDVKDKTSFTDYMVIVTGTSDRHLKALSDYVVEAALKHGCKPLGVEGGLGSDWVLVDLGDIVVHLMTAQTREFYQLEKLWTVDRAQEAG